MISEQKSVQGRRHSASPIRASCNRSGAGIDGVLGLIAQVTSWSLHCVIWTRLRD
jgi:hypothetical protein